MITLLTAELYSDLERFNSILNESSLLLLSEMGVFGIQIIPFPEMDEDKYLLSQKNISLLFEGDILQKLLKQHTSSKDLFILSFSETVLFGFRKLIVKNLLSHNDFQVLFIDAKQKLHCIEFNEYGATSDWPDGFFDQSVRDSEEILRIALSKRKEQRVKHENH